ncbi:hypothetical protein HMPREF0513_01447 [Limosilactobacillus fermentum 28-3-CHN]|uniref:Uncharacterized protein n=1 Tax=Limosilactobacillus fermentum 28-3-CHN TaxID=575599 RepID=D0DUV8_LIMFE|nr:hypothetical protein HMPREF0513_01447 [Limosilactobacillus fermentum 28-3-CHN]
MISLVVMSLRGFCFNKITNEDGRTTMVYWGAMLDELNMYREWLEARSPRPV